jgi:hypothetical protein
MKAIALLLLASSAAGLRSPSPRVVVPSPAFVRDAEIKHGRVAITSALVLSTLSAQGFDHPSAVLSQCSVSDQALFFSAIGLLEALVYLPRLENRFRLREGIEEGRIVESKLPTPKGLLLIEDVTGRLAMLGVAAFLVLDSIA